MDHPHPSELVEQFGPYPRVGGGADAQRLGQGHQFVEEGIGYLGVDVDSLDRRADLTGVGEAADGSLLRRPHRSTGR